ncbi:alcohol dehydrogenase [Neobacillus sp. D3-1R]
MSFIKKLTGLETPKSPGCCSVEIKEVEDKKEESCCGTASNESSCCN